MSHGENVSNTLGRLALYAYSGVFECERDDIGKFIENFLRLEIQAEQAEMWNARYNDLLEKAEGSRNQEVTDDVNDLPVGTVVTDKDGDPWWRLSCGKWRVIDGTGALDSRLPEQWAPYTVIHTPSKKES